MANISRSVKWACVLSAAVILSGQGAKAEEISGRIVVGGIERSYLLVLPDGRSRSRVPTVIALHGSRMDGRGMQRAVALDELAARDGFAVAYPDGLDREWNDGRRKRWGPGRAVYDDVGFITALARRLADDGVSDPRQLYLAGVSNGGMLTFRIACEAPGTVCRLCGDARQHAGGCGGALQSAAWHADADHERHR